MSNTRTPRWGWDWFGQYERTVLSMLVFPIALLLTQGLRFEWRILLSYNLSMLPYLLLTWISFQRTDMERLRLWATRAPPPFLARHEWIGTWLLGGRTGLGFVILASLYGLLVVIVWIPLLPSFNFGRREALLFTLSALLAVVISWLTAHLAFALHYAFLHNRDGKGLEFPGTEPQVPMDFAYVAFTVATTFALSDVSAVTPQMRAAVLRHTVFSFIFNTAILALTIDFAAR